MPDITIAAIIIGLLSVARTARLIAHDTFPPVVWLRIQWENRVRNGWRVLLKCQFCMTPYMTAVMFAWWYLADGHWTWWVINGVWGLSYLAAILVSYDQPSD